MIWPSCVKRLVHWQIGNYMIDSSGGEEGGFLGGEFVGQEFPGEEGVGGGEPGVEVFHLLLEGGVEVAEFLGLGGVDGAVEVQSVGSVVFGVVRGDIDRRWLTLKWNKH